MSTDRTNEIEEAASDWLIRRESEQWTPADQVRLDEWLEASALNRVAFLRLELAWEESARLKALGAGMSGDLPPAPGKWNLTPFFEPQRPRAETDDPESGARSDHAAKTPRARRFAVAAALFLTVVLGIGGYRFWSSSGDRYTTPVGGLSSVPMRDGSKIILNTNSEVRVALTAAERRVDLQQGEAYFEVAKDPARPFVVAAGKKRVVAVGTRFSVRREDESIEVVVTEGQVRVEDTSIPLRGNAAEQSGSAVPEGAGAPVLLTPGAVARANGEGVLVERKSLPEVAIHLSWRSGTLMFREQKLADAVAEFNRYNVRKIVIADPVVAGLKVEGNFRATNVDAFVRLLESGFPVRATTEGDRIVLSAK